VVRKTPRPHFTPGKDPVPILQEAGWVPGPVWTGEKSRPHRDSIPDRPARSQSLYRLIYPAYNQCFEQDLKPDNRHIHVRKYYFSALIRRKFDCRREKYFVYYQVVRTCFSCKDVGCSISSGLAFRIFILLRNDRNNLRPKRRNWLFGHLSSGEY